MLNNEVVAILRGLRQAATTLIGVGLMVPGVATAQVYDPLGRPTANGTTSDSDQQAFGQNQQNRSSPYPLLSQPISPAQIGDAVPNGNEVRSGVDDRTSNTMAGTARDAGTSQTLGSRQRTAPQDAVLPPPPNEFERFVAQRLGHSLPRFGASLITPTVRSYSVPTTTTVPPTYTLAPGDEIFIGLAGSIEGSVTREIDGSGRIFLPRIGQINLAGVTYGDLKAVIQRAVAARYRGFSVSVAVTQLKGIHVFVTGFANNPGSYTVDSLSTLVNAIFAAGGPSAGGSFRTARLIRNGAVVSDFDLYAFLRDGDRSRDAVLQNGDVIYLAPLGAQIALTGSVNQEAIYEARPGESLDDLLRFAGGATALADPDRLVLYTLANANTVGGVEVARTTFATQPIAGGDIVQILTKGTLAVPLERQTVVVRVEGEVSRPGNYIVPPATSFAQIFEQAGGLMPLAYPFGINFQRVSVRRQQRESFEEAIRQLEVTLAGAPLTSDASLSAEQAAQQLAAGRALLERLRQAQPDGRIVLPIAADGTGLPGNLALENNDIIIVPPRPLTVGVFGAVYRPASFLIEPNRVLRLRDYLREAGGTLRLADTRDIFVIHVNGAVLSRRTGALSARALPGDVIFVPTKTQNVSVLTRILQFSSLLFQGAIGAAATVALTR